uniref:Uncharacterized protein AlNc14C482G11894 n=1 Tax=Albugo laibachii Nc14 TaxID=890382 RepID=F0X0F3_9STRA|nr:hypothetical protein PITG_03485 [Albugo laibachii Nc14]|eukprot:CCA27240.1 hypothetical protein PITG_03485 [Albugo laibachii Nc14]
MEVCDKLMGKLEDLMEFLSFSVKEDRSFIGVVTFAFQSSHGKNAQQTACFRTVDLRGALQILRRPVFEDDPKLSDVIVVYVSLVDFLYMYSGEATAAEIAGMCMSGRVCVPWSAMGRLRAFADSFDFSTEKWEEFYQFRRKSQKEISHVCKKPCCASIEPLNTNWMLVNDSSTVTASEDWEIVIDDFYHIVAYKSCDQAEEIKGSIKSEEWMVKWLRENIQKERLQLMQTTEELEDEFLLIDDHGESECCDYTWLLQDVERRYQHMLQRELCQDRSVFTFHKYRNVLVEWMSQIGEEMRIQRSSIHSAITYLERLLQIEKNPRKRDLQLIGLCCIMIAAKFNGSECKVPTKRDVWEFRNRAYTCSEINKMELRILSNLSWCLTTIEPIHFIEFHKSRKLLHPDDRVYGHTIFPKMMEAFENYVDFFVDCCLQEYKFRRYRPSVMAASILAISRKALHIVKLGRMSANRVMTQHTAQLFEASRIGDRENVLALLDYDNADIDWHCKQASGATPLITAIAHGHVEAATALIEAGADLHQLKTPDQNSPLHEAAINGQVLILQRILDRLTNDKEMADLINLRNQFGNTPLHNAALAGNHECVEELLKVQARVSIRNANGSTPLHHACYCDTANCSVIKLLVDAGSNINELDNYGNPPIAIATRRGQKETINFLLKCGAEALLATM